MYLKVLQNYDATIQLSIICKELRRENSSSSSLVHEFESTLNDLSETEDVIASEPYESNSTHHYFSWVCFNELLSPLLTFIDSFHGISIS
jgi:hypothetical protein